MQCVDAESESIEPGDDVALPSISAGLQDAIVRGVAAFISARLKAEVELMVQERIADDLCTEEVAEALLSSTCTVARTLGKEGTPLSWGTIRSALQSDLEELPQSVLPLLVKQVAGDEAKFKEVKASLTVVSIVPKLIAHLGNRRAPIAELGELHQVFDTSTTEGKLLRRIAIAVQVIAQRTATEKPIKPADYARYGAFSARLLVEKLGLSKEELGKLTPELYQEIASAMIDLRLLSEDVTLAVERATKQRNEGESLDVAAFVELSERVIDTFSSGGAIALKLPFDKLGEQKKQLEAAFKISSDVAEAIGAARTRDYSALLASVLQILEKFEKQGWAKVPESVSRTLKTYGPFLVELASAEDADAVEKALQSAAAPVGSYKVKRGWRGSLGAARLARRIELGTRTLGSLSATEKANGPDRKKGKKKCETERCRVRVEHEKEFENKQKPRRPVTLSINAFAGASAGAEWLLGSGFTSDQPRLGGHAGLFMPVGIDLAVGVGAASSLQIFASLFDVGALGDFRFRDDQEGSDDDDDMSTPAVDHVETETEPKIGLAQVFSPGLYLLYGIHRTPLAIGAGASFSPSYRRTSLDSTADPESLRSTFQVSAVLAVDIPAFVLYRRGGRKRKSWKNRKKDKK